LYFASEQKAIFAAGLIAEFDPSTWEELLCFRYVAGERTPFTGIKRLLPGHYLVWKDGETKIRRWWNLSDRVHELREGGGDMVSPTEQAGSRQYKRQDRARSEAHRRVGVGPHAIKAMLR
jgi:asparagine synthetase B (glutamine-hydrolysing)